MKKEFFVVALFCLSICLVDELNYRIILACIEVLYSFHMMAKQDCVVVAIILIVLIVCSIPLSQNYFETGRVVAIKDNYLILQNGFNRVIAYYQGEANFDDTINVCKSITSIASSNNFQISTFSSWAKGNNIIGSIDLYSYEVLEKSNSLRSILYQSNIALGNNWANELLFGVGLQTDSDFNYLIIQSGLHISFLFAFLKNFYRLFFYQKKALIFSILTLGLVGAIFYFPFAFVRCILAGLLQLCCNNKKDATALEVIGCCLLKPYYIKSVSLLIPLGLKLISCFQEYRSYFSSKMYLCLIQLVFNGSCDLLSLFCFGFFRSIAGFFYLIGLICSLLRISISLDNLLIGFLNLKDSFPILLLKGKPNLFLIFLLLKIILSYLQTHHKKYLYYFCLLLVVNSNQSLFVPFYRVCQIDVGQGDSALICFPFSNKGLLIDVGGSIYKDVAKDILIPYLNSLGIKEVDVIITHEDYDHYGALESLQANFKVNNIYKEKQELIQINGLAIYNPLYEQNYDNDNDNSLVSYFSIGQFGFLYLADISSSVEKDLVETNSFLQVDFIKLSHHGSASGSSELLFETYRPTYAIISAGKNNSYGHPASEVVNRLEGYQIESFSTQQEGGLQLWVFQDFVLCLNSLKGMCLYKK